MDSGVPSRKFSRMYKETCHKLYESKFRQYKSKIELIRMMESQLDGGLSRDRRKRAQNILRGLYFSRSQLVSEMNGGVSDSLRELG